MNWVTAERGGKMRFCASGLSSSFGKVKYDHMVIVKLAVHHIHDSMAIVFCSEGKAFLGCFSLNL